MNLLALIRSWNALKQLISMDGDGSHSLEIVGGGVAGLVAPCWREGGV